MRSAGKIFVAMRATAGELAFSWDGRDNPRPMSGVSVEESRGFCHQLMKAVAKNFYYGMSVLPAAKRDAMFALYAFMRKVDDIADDGVDGGLPFAEIERQLRDWQQGTHAALAGDECGDAILPALCWAVDRFCIPTDLLDAAIEGQLQDLRQFRYATFDDLRGYCYRVASTVGIAAVYIWGFRDSAAIELADARGIAFQLTNILRDLREDHGRGRVYLPQDDLTRFGVDLPRALRGEQPEQFAELMRFEVERAETFYAQSALLEMLVEPDARATLRIMTGIYHGILRQIAEDPLAVLTRRVGLSSAAKMGEVARQIWRSQVERIEGAEGSGGTA